MSTVGIFEALIRLCRSAVANGVVIVLADLIPLAGVLWWGWDVFVIVLLYWLENGVIGVFNLLKLRKIEGSTGGTSLSAFFVVHYGGFWLGHGVFVLLLPTFFGEQWTLARVSPGTFMLAFVALVISHASEYVLVFLRERQYVGADANRQMLAPYSRVITLHVVIVLGAVLTAFLGQPVWLMVLMVLFKLLYDLGAKRVVNSPPISLSIKR